MGNFKIGKWLGTDEGITWANVAVNSSCTGVKFLVGFIFGSQTMIADALHSGADLLTDFAVLAGLKVSRKPADVSHNYGHGRVSTLVGMGIGGALGACAVMIAYQAVISLHNYLHKHSIPALEASIPLIVALASVPVKELLFQVTRRIGKRTGNVSVVANAWHSRADALVSLGAGIGLAGVVIGGDNWHFLDPATAMVISAFLLVAAWRIGAEAAGELIDRAPQAATLETIKGAVAGTQGVRSYHAFRARQIGGKVEMDIHVQVDPDLTVREGHDIASAVRSKIQQVDSNVVEVIVHVEPDEQSPKPSDNNV